MMLVSCSRSRERETAKAFLAQFDQVLEQSAALDKLDQETKPYDEQLEKALQQKDRITAAKALGAWVAGYRALVQQARVVEPFIRIRETLKDALGLPPAIRWAARKLVRYRQSKQS